MRKKTPSNNRQIAFLVLVIGAAGGASAAAGYHTFRAALKYPVKTITSSLDGDFALGVGLGLTLGATSLLFRKVRRRGE